MKAAACPCVPAKSPLRKLGAGLRWLAPATLLAVMPKCPMCLAAYIAMFSGIGLSLSVASALRTGLIGLCVLSLAYLVLRTWLIRRRAR